MNTPAPTNPCRQCGGPMASNAPEGLCARCLLSVALKEPESPGGAEADAAVGPAASPGPADFPDITDAADVARRLPQFEILELLGRGGMGVVYKARQLNLDRIVALKILPPADALTPDFVERFRREARSLAKLSHPNIVNVHDFGESGGLYYFVMEFVDGVNLRDMIRAGKMKPEEALTVVPKICDALQFAHEEGVVHRDIKPENILIDKRGRVKIADFGLAKLLRREPADHTLTVSGMTLGTPRYMAPEQLDKPETVDHRADIYSLGVVFYEMLTGEVPMGRFAPPSEKVRIDVRLDEIVLHALEHDVERRYQHASQVRDDVERVTSKPVAAPEAQAATSGPAESGARLLLDETDVAARRIQHAFMFGGFLWIVTGLACAAMFWAANMHSLLPIPIALCAFGVCGLVIAGRIRQQWEIDYLGHSVRFENGVYTSGRLMIDGKTMASGGIGPRTELSARIPSGPGAGDRIVVKTHALMRSFQCQLFVEPKGSTAAIGIKPGAENAASKPVAAPLSSPTPPAAPIPSHVVRRAGDIEPAQLTPLPRFFRLRSFGALTLGWIAVAVLWNLGLTGFVLGSVVMAAIVKQIGRSHANRNPLWVEKLRARGPWKRFSILFVSLLELVIVFMMFISGLFLRWDSSQMWNEFGGSSEWFEAHYKGREYQLIRQLEAFKDQVPAVELAQDYMGTTSAGKISDPFYAWWFIICGFLFLFYFFQQSAGEQAHLVRGPRRGGWGAAFSSTSIFLLSLACAYLALLWPPLLHLNGRPTADFNTSFDVPAHVNQVSNALHRWVAENGYASESHRWDFQTVPKGEQVARVEMFDAWKDSRFERWRTTGAGLEPPFPHISVQIIGSEKPVQSKVMIGCGYGVGSLIEKGSDKEKQWQAIIKSLSDAASKAPDFDPKLMSIVQPDVKHSETGSEWPGLCGVLAAMLLWVFVTVRYLTPAPVSATPTPTASVGESL